MKGRVAIIKKFKLLYVGTFVGRWVSDGYRKDSFDRYFIQKIFSYRDESQRDNVKMCNSLFKLIVEFKPDIIFINKGERILPIVFQRIKNVMPEIFIVLFNGDQRGMIQKSVVELGRVCDALLINNADKKQWNQYYNVGIKRFMNIILQLIYQFLDH